MKIRDFVSSPLFEIFLLAFGLGVCFVIIVTDYNCPTCPEPVGVDTVDYNYFPGDTVIHEYTGKEVVIVDRQSKDAFGWFYRIQTMSKVIYRDIDSIVVPGQLQTVHELALNRREECGEGKL